MAKRVLSIEIGQQVTKAVVTDYLKKNPHVYNAFSFDTPVDSMEDGYVRNPEAIASILRQQIKENGVKEKDVVFSIASSKVASREVVVPYVTENKLKDLIDATAQDYFPINMDEYTIAYNVLDIVKEADKKSLKLLLLAAPDTLVQTYYSLAQSIGCHVTSLDYYGNGSMQVLQKHIGSGYNVCVQIGSLNTMVSVMREGQQIMQRTIPYGTNSILDAVMSQPSLNCSTPEEAMDLLCRENILYSTLDYEDLETVVSARMTENDFKRSNQNEEARQAVTDAVGGILLSVIRVVDYFNSRYPNNPLMSIYITGMGVKIRGIDILFEKEMDLPVRRLEKLSNITFSRGFARSLQDQTEYIAAIGAAIEPVGFRLKSMASSQRSAETMKIAWIIFGACAGVAVLLVAIGFIRMMAAKSKNTDLKSQKASLEYINDIYNKNEETKKKYEEASALNAATYSNSEQLLALLDQLQMGLPSEMLVSDLQVNDKQVSLNVTTKTKISVAQMIMNFENIDMLDNIKVPSIAGSDDEDEYTFSVTADLITPDASAEGENADAGTTDANAGDTATAVQ